MKNFSPTRILTLAKVPSLVLALALFAPMAMAQAGGDDGGGSGGGGSTSNVQTFNGFRLTTSYTGTGQSDAWFNYFPGHSTSSGSQGVASASVSGVQATATAKGTRKMTCLVEWIGQGSAPSYAYILLTSSGNWQLGPGVPQAFVELGLPLTAAQPDQTDESGNLSRSINGRKVAKIKLDTTGKAEFEVAGSITVKAITPTAGGSLCAGTIGSYDASANLHLKALGLFMESYKRVSDSPPIGPPFVQRVLASGDDLEDQRAEIGLDPFDSQSNIFQGTIVRPQAGSWLLLAIYNNDLQVTGSPGFVQNVGFARDATSFDFIPAIGDPVDMRQAPKESKFTGEQSDPGSSNVGPFKGKLTVNVWAIERLLDKQPLNTRITKQYIPIYPNYPSHTPAWAGIDVVWHGTTTLTSAYVDTVGKTTTTGVSGGFYGEASPIKEIFKLGVKVDGKREWADVKTTTTNVAVSNAYTNDDEVFNPYHQNVTYKVYVRAEHKDMWRNLAKYGPTGYESDYTNTILDYDEPALYPGTDRFLTPL